MKSRSEEERLERRSKYLASEYRALAKKGSEVLMELNEVREKLEKLKTESESASARVSA